MIHVGYEKHDFCVNLLSSWPRIQCHMCAHVRMCAGHLHVYTAVSTLLASEMKYRGHVSETELVRTVDPSFFFDI
jgi:hypothetical protein